jgi:molybdate transport system substrate-binding protein
MPTRLSPLVFAIVGAFFVAGSDIPARAQNQSITMFAAASLKTALDDIAAQWRTETGTTARISYAASGPLAKQIEAGAPADIFVSADVAWMDYAAERKLIRPETRRNLLGNALVLVAPADSTAQPIEIDAQTNFTALLGRDGRLAMGEPKSVPAGAYAQKALTTLNLWDKVKDRIAQTQSVRAALIFVARGEAPLGIVYRSDAHAEPKVKVLGRFPASSHPPIVYPIAMIAASMNPDAKAFYDYLASPAASAIFKRESFDVLPGDARKAALWTAPIRPALTRGPPSPARGEGPLAASLSRYWLNSFAAKRPRVPSSLVEEGVVAQQGRMRG